MNRFWLILFCFLTYHSGHSQVVDDWWHGIERSLRYHPEGEAIVIENGERRFNRALYGANTGFRVETGDLPEFALYMPRLGGTIRLGLIHQKSSKWLINAEQITARYLPGKMTYEVKDSLLGAGKLIIEVLATHDLEGIIFRTRIENVEQAVLFWLFGGASDQRFNREGDIGADPESVFYLTAENCQGNNFNIDNQQFTLSYPSKDRNYPEHKELKGIVPTVSTLKKVDAAQQGSPLHCIASDLSTTPAVAGKMEAEKGWQYWFIYNPDSDSTAITTNLADLFQKADQQRQAIASRISIKTPDPFINTLGGVLSIAADAIWENPGYLHGAIAWRQPLNGWRGAYVADDLGWHDRARTHFRAYAKSQLTEPPSGPVTPDTSRNFARQEESIGTAIFTEGYISRYPNGDRLRAHHYDMNQVFIDQVLRHLNWTGDLDFVREMWPVIERHLAWEKRCFDTDGDALYDSYCSFWASDAVQYSGGGVTHASAYHYYANTKAAKLANLIGKDPVPYQREAERIREALNRKLWLPKKGYFAEFKDLLGLQSLHTSPGLWTIYHTIDSEVPDAFQTYQMLQYIDRQIPHIPIKANGLPDQNYYTLSTTNWLPYTWSVNNVALAEVMHTALAYWQGNRKEEAYHLWKSALLESMYLGASPGSIQQLSFYDAIRGELYRDFADPIGMTARSLIEGLFGIQPDLLNGELLIRPGFPQLWPSASLQTPDIDFQFERNGDKELYKLIPQFNRRLALRLQVPANKDRVKQITVNGKASDWRIVESAIGQPILEVKIDSASQFEIEIFWEGAPIQHISKTDTIVKGELLRIFNETEIRRVLDPQEVLEQHEVIGKNIVARPHSATGIKTLFVQVKQGDFTWWEPYTFEIKNPVDITVAVEQEAVALSFALQNHTEEAINGKLSLNGHFLRKLTVPPNTSMPLEVTSPKSVSGSNVVAFSWNETEIAEATITNWNIQNPASAKWETVDLSSYFNESVDQIFKQKYLSPRPDAPTVQLPTQGIGNWCYPWVEVNIDDTGLRQLAGEDQQFKLPQNIPFHTPGKKDRPNIIFTSQWDNYPSQAEIPLEGRAEHLYLLMAGSTNPMQSRMDNGLVEVIYEDGTTTTLPLHNPDTWWPIEQDYYLDGYAFYSDTPVPPRVHLKTGLITRSFKDYINIKGFSTTGIDGGAATVLDLPLDPQKSLKSLQLKTLMNDVVIGLMSASLLLPN